jgi:hypothetical protein
MRNAEAIMLYIWSLYIKFSNFILIQFIKDEIHVSYLLFYVL